MPVSIAALGENAASRVDAVADQQCLHMEIFGGPLPS